MSKGKVYLIGAGPGDIKLITVKGLECIQKADVIVYDRLANPRLLSYRRQDAVGTPFCVTVDHQTLEDNCVTIRHRDTMEQQRVAISDLHAIIGAEVNMKNLFKKTVE